MPELPEVETVRAGLERHVVGRTIAQVTVLNPRAVRHTLAGPDGFAADMADRTLLLADRRGKFLWFVLGGEPHWTAARAADAEARGVRGEALIAHLGMSGQLLVGDPDRPLSPHVRVRFTFTDGGPDLRFTDQRTFGYLMVDEVLYFPEEPRGFPERILHIAPDPLEADFSPEAFTRRLLRRKTQVKRALLNQELISGVGNIYADEALWRAKLHGTRPTETLKPAEVSRLLDAVREVLTEALKAGGTSFDALYVNVNGESGYFERSLNAYGREGEPCPRCGTAIRRESFMNRSSYFCPRCQPGARPVAKTAKLPAARRPGSAVSPGDAPVPPVLPAGT